MMSAQSVSGKHTSLRMYKNEALFIFFNADAVRIRRVGNSAEIGSISAQTFSSLTSKRLLPRPLQAPRVSTP